MSRFSSGGCADCPETELLKDIATLRAEVERLTRLFENAKQLRDVYQTERWELTARAEKAEALVKVLREALEVVRGRLTVPDGHWPTRAIVAEIDAALAKAGGGE